MGSRYDATGLLHILEDLQMVQCERDGAQVGWRFTHQGLRCLRPMTTLGPTPHPLSSWRAGIALHDRHNFELLLMLQDDGWEWKRLPQSVGRQLRCSPYTLGNAKIYRPAGILLGRGDLICLHSVQHLFDTYGVDEIPHGQHEQVYDKLLRGIKWQDQLPAILDKISRRKEARAIRNRGILALRDDGDEDPDENT